MDRVQLFSRAENETAADFLRRTATTAVDVWHAHDAVLVASVQAIPLDEQIASMWRVWNERLAGILTDQIRADIDSGLARPVSTDIPGLVSSLLEMTLHMFYKDRLDKCTEQQTRRMLDSVASIWLASVWGESGSADGRN